MFTRTESQWDRMVGEYQEMLYAERATVRRLRAQRRKLQRAARKYNKHMAPHRCFASGPDMPPEYVYVNTNLNRVACPRCYRVAHDGECRP